MKNPTWVLEKEGLTLNIRIGNVEREARVILGGDNFWTAYVHQFERKNGQMKYITLACEFSKKRHQTQDEARVWAEEIWSHMPPIIHP